MAFLINSNYLCSAAINRNQAGELWNDTKEEKDLET